VVFCFGWVALVGDFLVLPHTKRKTDRPPDLSIMAPGPVRCSEWLGQIKAIVVSRELSPIGSSALRQELNIHRYSDAGSASRICGALEWWWRAPPGDERRNRSGSGPRTIFQDHAPRSRSDLGRIQWGPPARILFRVNEPRINCLGRFEP
jgi:hypothetical protein